MKQWVLFYKDYFESEKELNEFILRCEAVLVDEPEHRAKVMMHQGKRLVSLANSMESVAASRDALKLMFLLIACEHISKLYEEFDGVGQSKAHVIKFFENFLTEADKLQITQGIELCGKEYTLADVVKALYASRCDVVHEGHYFSFDFASEKHKSVLTGRGTEQVLRVKLTYEQFRKILVSGIIRAVKGVLK
ncbi:TPA: hypothetical protein ACVO3I_004346 [Vibrio diabolicus]|uniref:hypothetical protein n=1 Tax=Vibrio harveyi group TaxID=717610 RepID=UPI000A17313E|nr:MULTISPECIES: hypothetical protein [Vibrio harveyi group]MCR9473467.1 hypothetical protein [Vibrio diabolicus]MCR9609082.1 hypothetical protein [Vibrio alginolyticus]MCR9613783.1 hypothetical protein [Vibrio alginolyticus]MCS0356436.1 hypothetical protein [Vibrio diabolicus]